MRRTFDCGRASRSGGMSRDGLRGILAAVRAMVILHDGPPLDTLPAPGPVTKAPAPLFLPGAAQGGPGRRRGASAAPRKSFGGAAEPLLAQHDRPSTPRRFGIGRELVAAREVEIALDGEAERQADGFEFGQREAAEPGAAEAEIGQAEEEAVRHDFGCEPGRRTPGAEPEALGPRVGSASAPPG